MPVSTDLTPEDIKRFWTKIQKLRSGCWRWLGTFSGHLPTFYTGRKRDGTYTAFSARRITLHLAGLDAGRRKVHSTCETLGCCNPLHLTWKDKGTEKPVAPPPGKGYNQPQRNEFSLDPDGDDFLGVLAPLRFGKSVTLVMDDPKYANLKNYRGDKAKRLVFLVPGQTLDIRADAVLVSVVGSGSCIVWPKRKPHVANLVLAGMPAKLAHVLMEKLHRTFQE